MKRKSITVLFAGKKLSGYGHVEKRSLADGYTACIQSLFGAAW
jgi:hypothetical protein